MCLLLKEFECDLSVSPCPPGAQKSGHTSKAAPVGTPALQPSVGTASQEPQSPHWDAERMHRTDGSCWFLSDLSLTYLLHCVLWALHTRILYFLGVFLAGLRLQIFTFHRRKINTVPRFPKKVFPAASELCKYAPRTHCAIPWEKRSEESVLWGLTAIPVVTLTKRNCTVWVPSKKYQAANLSQKTKIHEQSCTFNEEGNKPVCISGRFKGVTI